MDAGQLEEVVDHPRHPVDLGADLPVVARGVGGDAVLERLGHGPQPGQRGAQVVGHPGDQLAPRLLQAPLALAGPRPAARWSAPARRRAPGARPARTRTRRRTPRWPRTGGSPRPAAATSAPTRPRPGVATSSATAPATAATRRVTWKSWSERNIARAVPTIAGDHRGDGDQRDGRGQHQRPTGGAAGRRGRGRGRRRRRTSAMVMRTIWTWSELMRPPPSGSRRPRPSPGGPAVVGSGSIFSRSRRTCTVTVEESPTDQPQTCWSRSSRENATPGWATRKRSRSNSRPVRARVAPPRRRLVPGAVEQQVAVAEDRRRAPARSRYGAAPSRPAGPAPGG